VLDFYYENRLKFVTVTDVTITGTAERLAELIEKEEKEFDLNDWKEWPSFGEEAAGTSFVWTFEASEPYGCEDNVTWSCQVDLSALDWEHPWEDETIRAAESIYHRHRNPDPRWTLPHIEADAARYLQLCAADSCGSLTPWIADRIMSWFLHEAMPTEVEDSEDADPITKLLAEAMEDAAPVSTGILQLDSLLGGGLHRGLSILAGDPSAGKTALGIQLSLYAANQRDGSVVYAMCDQGGRKSALLRMVSCAAAVAGVRGCELGQAGAWSQREVYEGRQAYDRVSKGRVRLYDTTEVTKLVSQLTYLARTDGVSFAVLDFAQSMTFDGRALAFDVEAASLAVRELRAWAHRHNAVVLLLSAFSKSASEAHARGAVPQMSDILGSAELAYSAEHVLAIDNPHDSSGRVTVRDLKHRHGDGKPCTLHLAADHGLFS